MTTLITRTPKAVKTVLVIARVQFKADSRKVVYLVRGTKGEQYETYFHDGKATSCTCPARKPCYHMIRLEAREAARTERQPAPVVAEAEQVAAAYEREEIDVEAKAATWVDEEYEAWKTEQGLDRRLTRDEYVVEFAPDGSM